MKKKNHERSTWQDIPVRNAIMVHLEFTKRWHLCADHVSVQPEAYRSSQAQDKKTSVHIRKVIRMPRSCVTAFVKVTRGWNRINSVLMVGLLVVVDCLDVSVSSAFLGASAPLLLRALKNHRRYEAKSNSWWQRSACVSFPSEDGHIIQLHASLRSWKLMEPGEKPVFKCLLHPSA